LAKKSRPGSWGERPKSGVWKMACNLLSSERNTRAVPFPIRRNSSRMPKSC
jgi:hypothetical protein